MPMQLLPRARRLLADLAQTAGADHCLVDMSSRGFAAGPPAFCTACPKAQTGGCSPQKTHLYGSCETERWSGLYVYYCPLGLTFIAAGIGEERHPVYAGIVGPIAMGELDDQPINSEAQNYLNPPPQLAPARVTALARTQHAVCTFAGCTGARRSEETVTTRAELHNTLYELTRELSTQTPPEIPTLEIERQLVTMAKNADKAGAQELINQLLGRLYFHTGGDFADITRRAAELVVLLSRACIEAGADPAQVLGQSRDAALAMPQPATLTELSNYLTRVFHRFVGYVFDFKEAGHADILNKTLAFIRQNYTEKITLDTAAEAVYLSRSYLSRIFKEGTGQTFTEYVARLRIEKSRALLLGTRHPIADIAALVGFEDQSYFTKVFRRHTGTSPGEYRRRAGRVRPAPKTPDDLG